MHMHILLGEYVYETVPCGNLREITRCWRASDNVLIWERQKKPAAVVDSNCRPAICGLTAVQEGRWQPWEH